MKITSYLHNSNTTKILEKGMGEYVDVFPSCYRLQGGFFKIISMGNLHSNGSHFVNGCEYLINLGAFREFKDE